MSRTLTRTYLTTLMLAGCAMVVQAQTPATPRDGAHDFDPHIGTWRTHVRVLRRPLTGSTSWVEYTGTSTVRKVMEGASNLVELDVSGPNGRIVGASWRLFDPAGQQWSLNFANRTAGTLTPPVYGSFKEGRGEFYGHDTVNGRVILVRFVIFDVTATSIRFEQAFSEDGGKTWEVNWIAEDTRITG